MTQRTSRLLSASIALAVIASLTGCGGDSPEDAGQAEPEMLVPEAEAPIPPAPEPSEPDEASAGEAEDGAALPPPGAFRFVGFWAAKADMCETQAWRFTREVMETPAGSVCKFVNTTPVDGGYDISARCTAEGPPVDDMLKIRFAESAQAMLFESESVADAGLVHCGPLNRAL